MSTLNEPQIHTQVYTGKLTWNKCYEENLCNENLISLLIQKKLNQWLPKDLFQKGQTLLEKKVKIYIIFHLQPCLRH